MYACITRETIVFTDFRRVFHSILKLELYWHACQRRDQIILTCRQGKNMPTTALLSTHYYYQQHQIGLQKSRDRTAWNLLSCEGAVSVFFFFFSCLKIKYGFCHFVTSGYLVIEKVSGSLNWTNQTLNTKWWAIYEAFPIWFTWWPYFLHHFISCLLLLFASSTMSLLH